MFDIHISCVVFGVNPSLNKRCILSTKAEDIDLPNFKLSVDQASNINQAIIDFLRQYVFVNELELLPQMININSPTLKTEDHILQTVYGFIIDYKSSIDSSKAQWIDFDPLQEHRLSPIIFETMQ
ncbi:MAG: hypothetical protein EBS98_09845, partial [Chitinophagia bacterium]|nr:hypothetical protein [Chitinophagia bacterium]